MREFVASFEKELNDTSTGASPMEVNLYSSVTKSLKAAFDYVDLESVFSVIQAIARNARFSELGFVPAYALHLKGIDLAEGTYAPNDGDKQAASLLLERFRRHVRLKCVVGEEQNERIDSVYRNFFEAVGTVFGGYTVKYQSTEYRHGDWAVYTTNYDNVLERFAAGVLQINDLFQDAGALRSVLNTNRVSEEGNGRIKLVKLHGSVDWFRLSDGQVIRYPVQPTTYGRRRVEEEEMLYPIQQKDLYLYPWFEMFSGLKRDLDIAQHLIVIGYGFNDEFVRGAFKQAMRRNQKRVVFMAPHATRIWREYFGESQPSQVGLLDEEFGKDRPSDWLKAAFR